MKRREFIKTSAAGSAFLVANRAFAFDTAECSISKKYCYQSKRIIPIAYDVDVVIVGGSTAAVAAAVNAALHGATVFLAAMEPYLGEDICGNYRLWKENDSVLDTELGNKIFGDGLPTPLQVKTILDNELINNNIKFLYSSYATDILVDANSEPAGVIISNRSGRQAVIAKVIIDATPRAVVVRMTETKFMDYPAGNQQFKFVVVGNSKKDGHNLTIREMPELIRIGDKTYRALEYTTDINMKDGSWVSFAEAEQQIRDITWDANQVGSSDFIFQVPPDNMSGQQRWDREEVDSEDINLKVFKPQKIKNIFALNGCADISRKAAAQLLQPGGLICIGERVGTEAAIIASHIPALQGVHMPGKTGQDTIEGDVGELLEGLRPALNKGYIKAQTTTLPVLGKYDVVVVGGGTAGAPAALGASRKEADTLVIDYMHGLGGIGTLGMIGSYFHGYLKGFTEEVDKGVKSIGGDNPRRLNIKDKVEDWILDWKMEWYRSEIRKAKGNIWFGVLGCGAYVEKGHIKGVVVATPYGKGVVLGHTIIDSTGSADIAIAAGAEHQYTDEHSLAVQGAGLSHKNPEDFYNNTDWTFTDDSDILDVWRTFVVGKNKYKGKYDIGQLLQTRERRRIVGDFTISVLDVYNKRIYPDTISIHKSSFDTHGFTIDPFFALKPPASHMVDVTAYVPFRALLPKGIEGIVVTGLGVSAHRDAMPVIRMQACLQNQGYSIGMAAAIASSENQKIRYIDIKELQKYLVEIKSLPESVLTDKDNYPPSMKKVKEAAKSVVNNLEGLEIVLWNIEKGVPALIDAFHETNNKKDKLIYARILGMMKNSDGWQVLKDAVSRLEGWDEGWNFKGFGQFGFSMSYVDSLIIALGNSQKHQVLPAIIRMAKKLTQESHFSHFRAVAIALESIASPEGAHTLYNLLMLPGVTGHALPDIETAEKLTPPGDRDTSTRNNSLRELILGRALYRCGDLNGLGVKILQEYSKDLRGHYYRHASEILNKD